MLAFLLLGRRLLDSNCIAFFGGAHNRAPFVSDSEKRGSAEYGRGRKNQRRS